MPIKNGQGLAALRALSSGGSAGLSTYQQAQAKEAASRTTALQNALGGTDVAAAAQKAQAEYAPKLTGAPGIDNLDVAANSYLSNASNKLAAQNYEDQQNLTLQAEALKRQNNEQHMLAAADAMAAQQRADLGANLDLGAQATNLATRKAMLRQQLTDFDKNNQGLALAAIGGRPDLVDRAKAERQAILDQMGALDKQFAEATGQYTGALGTDNAGLLEAYKAADQGDISKVQGLVDFLAPQREAALEQGNRAINVGEQARLRELAPAFGIDPLTAAGLYREGEGKELGRVKQAEGENAYIAGNSAAQKAAQDDEIAPTFGFSSGKDYGAFKKSVDMADADIANAMQSSEWNVLGQVSDAITNGKDMFEVPGSGQKLPLGSGKEGLTEAIQQLVNNDQNPLVHEDGKPYTDAEKAKLVQLATKYYGTKVFGAQGKGATAEESQ